MAELAKRLPDYFLNLHQHTLWRAVDFDMPHLARSLVFVWLICLALAACAAPTQEVLPTLTASASATTAIQPSATPTIQAVETLLSSPTAPPTLSPAMTFMPTLSPTEAEAKILETLRENGGCRLPCFGGIVPGQTKLETLKSAWRTVVRPSITLRRDDLSISMGINVRPDAHAETVRQMHVNLRISRQLNNIDEEVFGNPLYAEYFQAYTLPALLSNYGTPTQVQVFLDVGIADMGLGIDLFLLFLSYADSGWSAMLTMPLLWKDDARKVALGCPSQASTQLYLWVPGDVEMAEEYGFEEVSSSTYAIEETAAQTLDNFHQQFKALENTECLEIPVTWLPTE